MHGLNVKPAGSCRWDAASLGEIMLRLDPGDGRIHTAREFKAWEGGGEYNVVRGLRRCFGLRTTAVTAFADNPVGRLVEDFMLQGGVDVSHVKWAKFDGIGREVRNGPYNAASATCRAAIVNDIGAGSGSSQCGFRLWCPVSVRSMVRQ